MECLFADACQGDRACARQTFRKSPWGVEYERAQDKHVYRSIYSLSRLARALLVKTNTCSKLSMVFSPIKLPPLQQKVKCQ